MQTLRALPERLLTVRDLAGRLRTSRASVYRLCEAGHLRCIRISTHAIRITEHDLSTFTSGKPRVSGH